jgi:hypothetical protein
LAAGETFANLAGSQPSPLGRLGQWLSVSLAVGEKRDVGEAHCSRMLPRHAGFDQKSQSLSRPDTQLVAIADFIECALKMQARQPKV